MRDRSDDETQQFPRLRPHGAPWQGPPQQHDDAPKFDRSFIAVIAILCASMVTICGILAWFLGEVIPG